LQFGVYPFYFGPIIVNLSIVFLGLFVLALAIVQKIRVKRAYFFEVCLLLFLVGFLFITLHGWLLQAILPISQPEKPLIDNNLTYNYTLSNILAYMAFPILVLILLKSDASLEKLGLRVLNTRKTTLYAFLGIIFSVFIFLFTDTFFGVRWISGYTYDGLVLWILLVEVFSVFVQTFFYVGILFNKYVNLENGFLLAIISILASQSYTAPAPLPWIVANIIGSSAKILVTWKTRNIYGATLMGIATGLVDILIQVL
jgi:hypothetical protein